MKKLISIFAAMFIIFSCVLPFNAYASDNTPGQADFTQEEFESLEHTYASTVQPLSSGLIVGHTLGIAKDDNYFLIIGTTSCISSVKRCGFSKVVVQRKKSNETSWSNYKTYTDLYRDGTYYNLSRKIAVTSGYQYRVTATHYAKKSLLSTEKINSTTSYLAF